VLRYERGWMEDGEDGGLGGWGVGHGGAITTRKGKGVWAVGDVLAIGYISV